MTIRTPALFVLAVACGAAGAAFAQATPPSSTPQNPGFETGEPGKPPPGWVVLPQNARAEIVADNPIEGRACALLKRADDADASFANLMQSLDATPYRGKRIELAASIRTAGTGAAQMWLRVDRPGGAMGFFDNMDDRPIRGEAWAAYTIRADVADDAVGIALGVFLVKGPGRAWIDGVSLRVLGAAGEGNIAPAPLSERGAANVAALARLLGVVRYFHPTSEAAALDWDAFTTRAVIAAEAAANDEDLAAILAAHLAPVAPTVRVWAGPGEPAPDRRPEGSTHAVGMLYRGYALVPKEGTPPDLTNVYAAARLRVPLTKDSAAGDIPPPGTAVSLALGGTVRARVPITLYADGTRTLPRAQATEPPPPPRPAAWSPAPGDRATRLAAVCIAWGTLRHFYPYFDVTPDDWDAALAPALAKAATDRSAEDFHRTLSLLLAHLHDGHGYVTGPGQGGTAPRDFAWTWVGDRLVVSAADPASSFRPGDEIIEIDGRSVADLYAEVAPAICAATEGWRRVRAAAEIGWAPGTGSVTVKVQRAGRAIPLSVARIPATRGFKPPLPADASEVAPGIVYFNLDRAETASLMAAWDKLRAAKAVIFDLRGYPGSAGAALLPYLNAEPMKSASWNIPIITMPNFENVTFATSAWDLAPQENRITAPVAFLTGPGAISYAESCMGIVEAYHLGEIVGAATAGTNGNVATLKLPAGYAMSFTGMRVLKHDGSRHHGVGIRPTVPASPTLEGLAAGRDEVLDKAVEVLRAKIEGAPAAK